MYMSRPTLLYGYNNCFLSLTTDEAFPLNFRFYVKNTNDLSCNYFGAIEVKQYCVLSKAKKSTSFEQLISYGL